jgi:hypothetical protein
MNDATLHFIWGGEALDVADLMMTDRGKRRNCVMLIL